MPSRVRHAKSRASPAVPTAPPPAAGEARRTTVYVLSDSTGNLARHMLTAFLTQFPPGSLALQFETFLTSDPRLDAALDKARLAGAAVCHAMVSEPFKRRVAEYCARAGLPCRDLTGHVVQFLADAAGVRPHGDVRSLHQTDQAYQHR